MDGSRYTRLRRRIAPLAFALGLGLLIHQTCTAPQRIHVTIVLDLGGAAPTTRWIEAHLFVDGDDIASHEQTALPGMQLGDVRFKAAMPEPDGRLEVIYEVDGTRQRAVRAIHAEEGATITVPIDR